MRAIFLAYLVMFSRHIVRAWIYHYRDGLYDLCRSITKMKISSWGDG